MTFETGQRVFWTSSNTRKSGTIVGIIPARSKPHDLGFKRIDGGGNWRDHVSYVVEGGPLNSKKTAQYWPIVSLLHPADGLTPAEIEWCQAHPEAVRALIARQGRPA